MEYLAFSECDPLLIQDTIAHAFNDVSRGTTTKTRLAENYKKNMSEKKADILINQISIHSKHRYEALLFANTQDVFFNTSQILQQNKEILEMLKKLVDLRKEEREERKR